MRSARSIPSPSAERAAEITASVRLARAAVPGAASSVSLSAMWVIARLRAAIRTPSSSGAAATTARTTVTASCSGAFPARESSAALAASIRLRLPPKRWNWSMAAEACRAVSRAEVCHAVPAAIEFTPGKSVPASARARVSGT